MREREDKIPSLSHTWLPYITLNGVRLAHETLFVFFSHKCPSMSHKFSINLSRQPNPERGYLWKFKNKNLWVFVAH